MSRIALSGASGLVGQRLGGVLAAAGHEVVRLVRRAPKDGEVAWNPARGELDPRALEGIDGFVHLSGESLVGRWSTARKREIVESRTVSTRLVCGALARLAKKPALVCASAIGIYGDRGGGRSTSRARRAAASCPRSASSGSAPATPRATRVCAC
jgi:NAD dependent epimerase/dehydratase family enzyme